MAARIKPVKAWAIVDKDEAHPSLLDNIFFGEKPRPSFKFQKVVRVEIRVIEPKRRAKKGRK